MNDEKIKLHLDGARFPADDYSRISVTDAYRMYVLPRRSFFNELTRESWCDEFITAPCIPEEAG